MKIRGIKNLTIGLSITLLGFTSPLKSVAQVITAAEYFINTDPGPGKGTPVGITAANRFAINFSISSTGLSQGFNQLFIRTKDDSARWGIAEQRTFYIDNTLYPALPTLTNAEYFFDSDPGTGAGVPLTINNGGSINTVAGINLTGLTDGFHQLFIRVKNFNNGWGIAEQRTFYVDNTLHSLLPTLSAAEYFYDLDPGVGNGLPLTIRAADTLVTLYNINTTGLPSGFHQLFIRVKNIDGSWGIAEQRTFLTDDSFKPVTVPLVAAEYFIDKDAGAGNNTPIAIIKGDTVNKTFNYTAPNLPQGRYYIYVRVQDSLGNWSIADRDSFYVCNSYGPLSNFTFLASGATVSFINTSQYGTSYHWIFGDGDTSNLPNPVHTYPQGFFTACLITKNGCVPKGDTICKAVTASAGPVPVTLLNFTSSCTPDKVLLSWQTATEINSSYFQIQKSSPAVVEWGNIGIVAAAGNSPTLLNYQFTDKQASGAAIYRLQQVDADGKITYSPVVKSNCNFTGANLQIYPVPATDKFTVVVQSGKEVMAKMILTDIYGKTVRQLNIHLQNGTTAFVITTNHLAPGEYFFTINGVQGLGVQKVIIAR